MGKVWNKKQQGLATLVLEVMFPKDPGATFGAGLWGPRFLQVPWVFQEGDKYKWIW